MPSCNPLSFHSFFTTLEATVTKHEKVFIDAYQCLIFCIISLRTKDEVTEPVSLALFAKAPTPPKMVKLSIQEIAKTIYPCGFFNRKAQEIRDLSFNMVQNNQSQPPATLEELLAIRGVGLKTANLVLSLGHGIPAICVDTHVHRISNRLGFVNTKTPDQTEKALRAIMPKNWWIASNDLMVRFGQQICKPVKPLCQKCPFKQQCPSVIKLT